MTSIVKVVLKLQECMQFQSNEETISTIKQYHINNIYKFNFVEYKPNIYIVRCLNYHNDYPWRLWAAYSKVHQHWKIKNIARPHACFSTILSEDHTNLDSNHIVAIVSNSVRKTPPFPSKV